MNFVKRIKNKYSECIKINAFAQPVEKVTPKADSGKEVFQNIVIKANTADYTKRLWISVS